MAHSAETRQAFLDALARTGVIGTACAAAGITRPTVYAWRQDPDFEAAYP